MSSRERILELSRKLEKAINKSDESSVLSILQSLTNANMNIQLLTESGLGKKVNTIRKCKSFDHSINIKETAQQLVTQWKESVAKEKKALKKLAKNGKNGKNGKIYKKNAKNETKNEAKRENIIIFQKNDENTNTNVNVNENGNVNINGNMNVNENVNVNVNKEDIFIREEYNWQTGDDRRDKMISKFIEVLKPKKDLPSFINYMTLAADIESTLSIEYGNNNEKFIQKYRDLHYNLKKNKDLVFELLLGNMKIKKLVTMSSEQLAHKSLKEKRDKERKMAIEEARNDHGLNVSQAMTDEYKCGKCKQRKCKYSQAQTRSADEPMTTFVTCLVCGNRWKC